MPRNIVVEQITRTPIEEQKIELVERKGIGHPDSLCDGIAEAMSRALSNEYLNRFGRILHHNTDQVELVGGEANPTYGGGEIIRPIFILLSGRATTYVGKEKIPVGRIVLKAAREYLKNTLRNLEEHQVIIDQRLGQGSADLVDVFERLGIPRSNDTSFGVGFAPFSETEKIVYNVERAIVKELIPKQPAIGEDMKVMALREGDKISLTVADAFVSKYVHSLEHYKAIKAELEEFIKRAAEKYTHRDVIVAVNTGDNFEKGIVYLTVTGTSSEMGDDGSVGRGNRCNGLITPNRPMSLEATAGKNPVNHIGKIYNLLANQIAHNIVSIDSDIQEVYVRLLSQIGEPIDEPKVASVQLLLKKNASLEKIKPRVEAIVDAWLEDIIKITEMVVKGELQIF
ncbi:MAG: methionine adenosyltransferase [Halobacteria archaeon]